MTLVCIQNLLKKVFFREELYPSKILPNGFSNGILPEVDSVKITHDGKAYYNNVPTDLVQLGQSQLC